MMGKVNKVEIKEVQAGKASETFQNKDLHTTDSEENIIVIGSQRFIHDDAWFGARGPFLRWDAGPNGKFMFIHQAMRKVFMNPELNWKIIIYTAGYSEEQIDAMRIAITNKLGICNTLTVNVYDHLYNYINSMDHNDWSGTVSEERKKNRIRRIYFYSHGVVFRLAMGITNRFTTDDDMDITTSNIHKLSKDAFYSDARIYCFACRTGLGNDKINDSVYYTEKVSIGLFSIKEVTQQYNLYTAQSLAQKLADTTGATVYAYLRRSEYSDTLNTAEELDFKDAYEAGLYGKKRERKNKEYDYLSDNKKATESDKKKYDLLQAEDKRRKKVGKAWLDPEGAKYPVRAAATPKGLPDDMKTFKRLKT